jgi:hypothetical protein
VNTTTTVVSVLVAVFGGATAAGTVFAQSGTEMPWEVITGSGAAGLVMVCVWVFLKRDKEVRSEHVAVLIERDKTIKEIAHDFSQTSTSITNTFAETTRASEDRAERREKELREWMHTLTRDRP